MRLTTEENLGSHLCVVHVNGDIDTASAPDVQRALTDAIGRGCTNLVLDLSQVPYADSSALAVIAGVNRILEPHKGRLVLASATANVRRVLEISGLVGVAPTISAADDLAEAVAGLTLSHTDTPPLWSKRIDVPASAESLAGLRARVSEMLEPLHLAETTEFDIRVAVGEALSNAVRHGSPRGEGDTVGVMVSRHEDRVVLTVSDNGGGFDGSAPNDCDPYAPSGRGVMFMRALMDQVEFACLPGGGTSVTLVKHLGAPAARV